MVTLLIHELSKMGSCNLIYEIEKGPQTIARGNCPNGLSGFGESLNSFENCEGVGQKPKGRLGCRPLKVGGGIQPRLVTVLTPATTFTVGEDFIQKVSAVNKKIFTVPS